MGTLSPFILVHGFTVAQGRMRAASKKGKGKGKKGKKGKGKKGKKGKGGKGKKGKGGKGKGGRGSVDEKIHKLSKMLDRLWSEKLDEKIDKQVRKAVRYVGEGRKGEFFGIGREKGGREESYAVCRSLAVVSA